MKTRPCKVGDALWTWNCRDKMSGEQFEVRGHDESEIIAAIEDYICSGIDPDTGSVQYDVTCTAVDGSTLNLAGVVEPE